ncbi:MAG: FtsX-like permease family protein [Muricomes sp.]
MADVDFLQSSGLLAIQVNFTDNPDDKEIKSRIEKIKKLYDADYVLTASEYVEQMVGVGDTLDSVKYLVLILAAIISALVTVLMERSFIEKERGEIAVMKAIGFKSKSIIATHTLRLGIAAAASVIIAALLSTPLTRLTITPIFDMMGAGYGIEYAVKPLDIFVIYPLLMLFITLLFAFISSQYTRTIKACEATNIE